jgi:hypothetical protein
MSLSTQHIIRHLFGVESLEEVSRQQLEELVGTYPSFGVGRYLLSRKLQTENADHFNEETQKTNLYFTNPFWLQWLLQEDLSRPANGFEHISPVREDEAADTELLSEDTEMDTPPIDTGLPAEEVFAPVVDTTEPTVDAEISPISEPDEIGESPLATSLAPSAADELLKSIAELRDHRQASEAGQTPVGEASQPPIVPQEETPSIGIAGLALEQLEEKETAPEELSPAPEEQIPIEETLPPEEMHAQQPVLTDQFIHEDQPPANQPPAEEPSPAEQTPIEETRPPEQVYAEEPTLGEQPSIQELSPVEQAHTQEPTPTEQPPIGEPTPALTEQPTEESTPALTEPPAEELHPTPVEQSPVEVTSFTPTPPPPAEGPAASTPIFEPYHTVDYFASQGIRLVLEENPSDKLGKQLKSFTDWLKVMRKLPQKNREIVPDIAAERQVQAIAAHSIERKEVVTEAMAEVLAKQGMREKATEMYRKLSLLEPGKSAYFAEKIEKLKII